LIPRSGVPRAGLIFGIGVSVVLTAIFAIRLDWVEFRLAMANVDWRWVAGGCSAVLASITVRAIRWFSISGAQSSWLSDYWNATVIGYVGNMLYPGRAGELLKVAALHHATGEPPGRILTAALMDRTADVVALSLAAIYVIGVGTTGRFGQGMLGPIVATALVPLAILVVLLRFGARFEPVIARLSSPLPGLWRERIPRWYAQAHTTCAELAKPFRLLRAFGFTALAYSMDYAVYWLFLQAFGWPLPFLAPMTIAVLLAFGSLLPAAPGNVGIYQVACVLALGMFAIGESSALAFSLVAQGATLLVIAVLGVAAATRYGFRFRSPSSDRNDSSE
jgi:uncharacterized protein (TIRG00374 family)